jgi:DNA-binding SARP family transcriptional activator/predicted ATPase
LAALLKINLLGGFRIVYGDTPVTALNAPRLQALLAYLVLHRSTALPRQHVAFMFWPDSIEAQAHTNLRKALYRLYQTLPRPDEFLCITPKTIQWRAETDYRLDVIDFEAAIKVAVTSDKLREAIALYSGDLFPDCYEEWILPERDRLSQVYIRALERLIQALEHERDYTAAIDYTQQLLRCDGLHEGAYRSLMRLHMLNSNTAGALRAYHTCATVLQRELGVEPSRPTQEIYEELTRRAPLVAPARALSHIPPFVNRKAEMTRLQDLWQTSVVGQARFVLITGDVGIGKTRLAEEFLHWAERQEIVTRNARCYDAEGTLAYAPVTVWLRARPVPDLDRVWLSELARLVPEVISSHPDIVPAGPLTEAWQRQRLFETLARALTADQPAQLLLIDNLQWCDRDTLDWLHYLLRFAAPGRLLVVGTLRPDEASRDKPIVAFLRDLTSSDRFAEIKLDALTDAETTELAARLSGGNLDAAWTERLYRETEGVPMFVVELVRAKAEGRSDALPPRMQSVLTARLAPLSAAAHDLAELAAAIGREFTFDLLKSASGEPDQRLVTALDELWQRRIVRQRGPTAYDFSHDKLREVIYAQTSTARRQLLHRRVAEALELLHASSLDRVSAQIAAHYEHAGLADRAAQFYYQGAVSAQSIYANEEALILYRSALDLIDSPSDQISLIYENLADVLTLTGRYDEARSAYALARRYLAPADQLAQARLCRKIGNTWSAQLIVDEALREYDNAAVCFDVASLEADAAGRAEWLEIQIDRLRAQYLGNRMSDMELTVQQSRPMIVRYGSPLQMSEFYQELVLAALRFNRHGVTGETSANAQLAWEAALKSGNPRMTNMARFAVGFCSLWQGDPVEGKAQLELVLQLAEQIGDLERQVLSLTYLAVACRMLGQTDQAADYANRAMSAAAAAKIPNYLAIAQANLAWAAWRAHEWEQAQHYAEQAVQQWQDLKRHAYVSPLLWLALWPRLGLALKQGRIDVAIECAQVMLDSSQQRLPEKLSSLLTQAIAGWAAGDLTLTRRHLEAACPLAERLGYL